MKIKYNHKQIEEKWKLKWEESGIYKVEDKSDKPKYYILDMFPYPSGEGLHVGHPKGYIATDIFARMKTMQGFNVLHPMGWDAFGLPAENYAIKNKVHPKIATEKNIETFKRQLGRLGLTYDWEREISTIDPEFYKWTQWIFLQMFERGLAYESHEPINWCSSCKTGLANEDLEDGKCERCGTEIERKPMRQWVLKITDYADRLLDDIDKLDEWEDSIKDQQRNWIGKSSGAKIKFNVVFSDQSIFNDKNNFTWDSSQNEAEQIQNNAEQTRIEEGDFLYKDLTYKIRGAVFNVKKEIGLGHKESIYHEALKIEFEKQNIFFESEKNLSIKYDGKKIGVYRPDFIIEDKVLIELKALPRIGKQQLNQTWTYLKGNNYKLALLINFSPSDLEIKRMVYDTARDQKKNSASSASISRSSATSLEVFTTRPDTLFGATYMVVAPEHELIEKNKDSIKNYSEIAQYIKKALNKSELERGELQKEKTGIKIDGLTAINPVNEKEIPIFVADYVLAGYGTGAIMAVPAHDERDWEFAKKYDLDIFPVVIPKDQTYLNKDSEEIPLKKDSAEYFNIISHLSRSIIEQGAISANGINVNSDFLDGLDTEEAKSKIISWLSEKKIGKKTINFKLQDWVFSRQRYWGDPIPLIHCESCGVVPVPESDLPVLLPNVEKYEPTGTGESPLAGIDEWVNTTCPKCGGTAKRETNTMPQWAGSSWYYLRYLDPKNDKSLVDKEKEAYWSPVDFYVGGAEHATRHLIYARFWHKFLFDIGVVSHDEPFKRLQHVGLIGGEDGRKMSKRWGNVVNPDDIVEEYGADSMRVYEMFMGPFAQAVAWSTNGLVGARKFLEKVLKVGEKVSDDEGSEEIKNILHKTIKKVGSDIEDFKFNTAISQMMILVNKMGESATINREDYLLFIRVLAPFAPHLAEEIWAEMGNKESITKEAWPKYNEDLMIDKKINLVLQVNGKVRATVEVEADISEEEAKNITTENEVVKKWIEGKEILKVIFVKGKLVNIVVR